MQIVYGQHVSSTSDKLFVLAEEFVRFLLECFGPSLLDISPYCKSLQYSCAQILFNAIGSRQTAKLVSGSMARQMHSK
jgi:hypothetical protein